MTDERRDDEIIGRALSRAIETIDVNQTPFERSRIATAPARRSIFGLWQFATAAAAIVLALAIGSWLTRPTEGQPGVAASPTATAPSSSPAGTQAPASATPAQDRIWVYFARDGLPPTGGFATGSFNDSRPESRILSRLSALREAKTGIPAGAINAFARPTPTQSGTGAEVISVSVVQGDLVTVEFELSNGWGVSGSAQSHALLQQLVYTITEEPGVRRALITEKGKPNAVIDQLIVDKPLSREDVFGYEDPAKPAKIEDGGGQTAEIADWRASVDEVAPGLGRFVLEFKAAATSTPSFVATLERPVQEKVTADGKWIIRINMPDALWNQPAGEAFQCCPTKAVGKTPIIQTEAYPLTANPPTNGIYRGVGFAIILDDARPWRVFTLSNPARIIVDVGGPTRSVSDRVAVYQPRPGATVTRDLQITGAGRTYEANVSWRLFDSTGRQVASGNFTGGSSGPLWGAFDTHIAIPASVSGNVTLEVLEFSAKDGSPVGVTQIPLTVR
jgi:immunoglobulin-like protein involved in spore germination/sporulation and spore germination protein